jgi:hypothetical protein
MKAYVATCACGAAYAHPAWCALPHLGVCVEAIGRLDVWALRFKTVMPDGARCRICATLRHDASWFD